MKKYLVAVIVVLLAVGTSLAGVVDVSGRAGIFTAPGSSSSSAMYGLAANVRLTDNWSVRGSVDTTSYTVNNVSTTYVPVRLDVIYSQTIAALFHPYAGVGVSYNTTTVTGNPSTTTSGAQAEVGVLFNLDLAGFSAGVEYCYIIPDLSHSSVNASSYNAYMTAGFTKSFGF
jgi:outer membrane protein W